MGSLVDTNFIRKVDDLGRVLLPAEVRSDLNITTGTELLISQNKLDGTITLSIKQHCCVFCNTFDNLAVFMEKHICHSCMSGLKSVEQ